MTKLNKHMALGVTLLCLSALIAGASASEEMAEGMPEVLRFSSYMGEPGAEVHIAEWPSQMAIVAAAEKYMGMPIEIEWELLPPGDHRDRQAVYLASGDLHDVFSAGGNVETINNLGELGQIINILDYEDELLNYKVWLRNGELQPGAGRVRHRQGVGVRLRAGFPGRRIAMGMGGPDGYLRDARSAGAGDAR